MNKLKYLLISGFFGFSELSCNNGQNTITQKTNNSDPIEFARDFNSVCKVGIKGGDGTLIESNWVLTAGHVAEGMYKRTNGNLFVHFEIGTKYKVKNVFLHPNYEPMGLYDIALLQLVNEVNNIMPVKINTDTNEINNLVYLIGHGDKKQIDGNWIKDGKLRGYTNKIDQVTETHIVFDYDSPENNPSEREGTSGPGDSGEPAFIKLNDSYYVAGVSSMGEPGENGPATFGAIEHFVRVSKFQNWIQETIKMPNPTNAFLLTESNSNNQSKNLNLSNTVQAQNAQTIIDALSSYSEEKMIDAISKTYDLDILKRRTPKEIIHNMPVLIEDLQNSICKKLISESTNKISLLLIKDNNEYALDIFFVENSKKIEQMGFAKLN